MRRLLAFGLDYLVIIGYLIVLAGVSLAVLASGLRTAYSAGWATDWSAEAMGFLVLTELEVGHRVGFADDRKLAVVAKYCLELCQPAFGSLAGEPSTVEVEVEFDLTWDSPCSS